MTPLSRRELLGGLGGLALTSAAHAGTRPPNFLFVVADDMGWADARCYGNRDVKTPSLDNLARQGILFTNGYAPATVCSPSRAGMLTGRFPSRDRIFNWIGETAQKADVNSARGIPDFLDPAVPTVASVLKQAGYATALFGKWHLGRGAGVPEAKAYGFDRYRVASGNGPFFPQPNRPTASQKIVDETIAFVEENKDRPWIAHVWFLDPHVPLEPSEETLAAYETGGGILRTYYAVMQNMDAQLGRLVKRIDELGLGPDTVIVFTSDNGGVSLPQLDEPTAGGGGNGPFRGCKGSLYEGGIRVPFIVRWSGSTPAGKVDDVTPVCGVDLLPTACALAGVAPPADVDGVDLGATLRGRPTPRARPLFWEWRAPQGRLETIHTSPMLAMRDGAWKLLANPDGSRTELYDLTKDPGETDNLAREYPSAVDAMRPALLAFFASLPKAPLLSGAGQATYPWPKGK